MENEDTNGLIRLFELVKSGEASPKDLIRIAEREVKNGKIEPDMLTYLIKYLNLIEKINKEEYININELIDIGLYDSIEEIHDVINENPEDFKKYIFKVKPCTYPEPTLDEINENIAYQEDNCCIICCSRTKNTVFIPCGHCLCCTVCSKTLAEDARSKDVHVECLVCKQKVLNINKIYV